MKKRLFLIITLVSLAVTSPLFAKQFYRFVNTDGKLVIKDQVTNEMVAKGYEILNANGRVIKKVAPGKTLAEMEEDRLAQIEEKKKEIELQQRIRHDAELLRQFSSIGDIIRNRDAQLLALEQRIRIQGSKSDLLRIQLEDQQRQAAIHERLGQKLPKALEKDIANTMQQLAANDNNSKMLEEEKVTVAERFQNDIIRYKELESLRRTLKKEEDQDEKGTKPVVFECPNSRDCQKAWQLAQIYAKDNASGRIEIITNTLILTSKPEEDNDVSLSFSRIPSPDNRDQIVFEVTCSKSDSGVALCKSDVVKNLRINYLNYVKKQI